MFFCGEGVVVLDEYKLVVMVILAEEYWCCYLGSVQQRK